MAAADVFVFPSLTDTFGLVMLEAMACGVPVAAFPVTGPLDVVQHGKTGVLDRDLRAAVIGALELDPGDCVAYAKQHTWLEWTQRFVSLLEPVDRRRWQAGRVGHPKREREGGRFGQRGRHGEGRHSRVGVRQRHR